MTPYDLINKLRIRFNIQPPPFIDQETLKIFTDTRQRPIRLRVINVIKHWLTEHFYDFDGDPNLCLKLISLLCDTIEAAGGVFTAASDQLKNLLQQKVTYKQVTYKHRTVLPIRRTDRRSCKNKGSHVGQVQDTNTNSTTKFKRLLFRWDWRFGAGTPFLPRRTSSLQVSSYPFLTGRQRF